MILNTCTCISFIIIMHYSVPTVYLNNHRNVFPLYLFIYFHKGNVNFITVYLYIHFTYCLWYLTDMRRSYRTRRRRTSSRGVVCTRRSKKRKSAWLSKRRGSGQSSISSRDSSRTAMPWPLQP